MIENEINEIPEKLINEISKKHFLEEKEKYELKTKFKECETFEEVRDMNEKMREKFKIN